MKLFRNQSIPSFHRSDRVLQSHQQKTTSPLSLSLSLLQPKYNNPDGISSSKHSNIIQKKSTLLCVYQWQ